MNGFRIFLLAALLGALPVVTGCGGSEFGTIGKISGTLMLDGDAVPAKTKVIFMHPTEGYAGFGFTDDSGNFTIEWRRKGKTYDGLPVGKYEVMIVQSAPFDVDALSADEMLDGKMPNAMPTSTIPAKYLRASTSGLKYEVEAGENNFDIQISKS